MAKESVFSFSTKSIRFAGNRRNFLILQPRYPVSMQESNLGPDEHKAIKIKKITI
jgi:hypothetical protein